MLSPLMNYFLYLFVSRKEKSKMFPARFELATFRVWGGRDNPYTTETNVNKFYTVYLFCLFWIYVRLYRSRIDKDKAKGVLRRFAKEKHIYKQCQNNSNASLAQDAP